jgi:hypothetical protein
MIRGTKRFIYDLRFKVTIDENVISRLAAIFHPGFSIHSRAASAEK